MLRRAGAARVGVVAGGVVVREADDVLRGGCILFPEHDHPPARDVPRVL